MSRHQSSPAVCPELEDLAAFLDGRVAGAERDRIADHVASCERCYELFTESRRFLEEETARGKLLGGRFGGRSTRRWLVAAAAAAGLAVAFVWGPWEAWLGAGGRGPAAAVLARVDALVAGPSRVSAASLVTERGWSEARGASEGGAPAQRAFRLGVLLVDLETALRLGAADEALALLPSLERLAGGLVLPERILELYAELGEGLRAGEEPAGLTLLARSAAEEAIEAVGGDSASLELGSWAEAARLTVAAGRRPPAGLPAVVEELPGGEPRSSAEAFNELLTAPGTEAPELAAAVARLIERGGNG